MIDLNILYNDNNLLVAIKPSGLAISPDKTGDKSFVEQLSENQNSQLYVINRLDRPVGGITVFAKNPKSAAQLTEQIKNGYICKKYAAVVCGDVKPESGSMKDYIVKNGRTNISKICNKGIKDAKEAILNYKCVKKIESDKYGILTLVDIELITGRHHQIRVQFSSREFPLWGDRKYNNKFKFYGQSNIALFSSYIKLRNPISKEPLSFEYYPDFYPFDIFKSL